MSNETAIVSLKEKIDDLNQQAWEVRVTDLPKSFELSQESVNLARSINYPKGLADGLRSLGFSYVRYSKNDEGAPLLKESLSLYQSLNDLKGQAVVYEYLGIIERNWGNLGASLDLLLKANEIVLQTGPLEVELTCSYQLGVTYKHLGNHENALDYLYKTLSVAKKINYPLMEAYATNIIGSIYFDNGNYNQALDCYQQGLPIRQQSHDKWGEAGSLDNIGFTYLKLNDLDKAIEYCKQSLAICQGTGDKKGEANALLHLGEIYEKVGDIKQATGFSNESLEIRKNRGDKRGETEVLLFLADLYKNRNDVEDHQIFEWISGALKIADEIKAQDLLSKAYYNLHEYYQRKGDFKESLVQLEAHFQIEKELHKNSINQKVANLEISHKAEVVSQRNKELTELNEQIEKANEELKIERSLERVRTAAMAMNEPADMLEVCKIISDQLDILHVKKIRNVQTAIFYEEKKAYMNYEYYAKHDKLLITEVDYNNHPVAEKFANQMLKGPNQVWTHGFKGQEVKDWLNYQRSTNVFIDTHLETADSLNYYWYSLGPVALGMSTYVPLNENEIDLFKRFRNVFELAYRRYLDIEKAQAQAREAQIEAALEKIRSRSLAMHQSKELKEVIAITFEKLNELNVILGTVAIQLFDKKSMHSVLWVGNTIQDPQMVDLPYDKQMMLEDTLLKDGWQAMIDGVDIINKEYSVEQKNKYFNYLFSNNNLTQIPEQAREVLRQMQRHIACLFVEKNSAFLVDSWAGQFFPKENLKVLKRAAKVFEQAYIRFLDLQKAEAQAREAQIEASLERTRTQSMIMQHSKELDDTLRVFHQQVLLLGINSAFSFLWLPDEKNDRHIFWAAWGEDKNGSTVFKSKAINYPLDRNEPATAQCLVDWKSNEPVYSYHVSPAAVENYFALWQELIDGVQYLKPEYFSSGLHYVEAFMKYGCFGVMVATDLTEDEKKILSRFANEFERTYTRFLDLQKAEVQAREAQIEAGLERVRSRSLAMHNTSELQEVIHTVHKELLNLNIAINGGSFIAINKDVDTVLRCWGSGGTAETSEEVRLPLYEHPFCTNLINRIKSAPSFFTEEYTQKEKKDFFTFLFKHEPWSKLDAKQKDETLSSPGGYTRSCYVSQHTSIFIINHFGKKFSAADNDILQRFGKVFEQAYTRFLDLQKAEAQTREAKIEAALERVRARALAMQEPEELKDVALVLRSEMGELGVEELETCSIYINDEATNKTECWYALKDSREEGKKLVSDHFPLNLNDTWVGREMKIFYGSEAKQVSIVMQGADRKEWINYCEERSVPLHGYYGEVIPDRTYHLYKFSHGAIGAAAAGDISAESWKLLSRAASVFSLAYSRFKDLTQARNDLVQLKEEKKRAEEALTELQATQKQLIQAEKMASLGELTAGIAHEIQNPLNFVNNFSDVSNELLEEMKQELATGNTQQAIEIAGDVKENLEKILHHGKRADAIVKGMLQHSRTSSGQKELTDINVLADEYLRLAYHGLRAKDKFFNAKFETHLDPSITKINIVPQEIGRVILNLINNSFYAVSEKKNAPPPPEGGILYEPVVTVTTKRLGSPSGDGGRIEIRVADNGNGIPKKALDKIFQPFFTTKPTGQGTGLGLSLSYDIVTKGHDGEIKVETKEGEGSAFTISLPMK